MRTKGWRGRQVTLLPAPWVYTGRGVRSLKPSENRWLAACIRGEVRLKRIAGEERVVVKRAQVHSTRGRVLLLRRQPLLVNGGVELLELPRGYWAAP